MTEYDVNYYVGYSTPADRRRWLKQRATFRKRTVTV